MDLTRDIVYRGLKLTGAAIPVGGGPIEGIRLTRARYSEASVHGYVEKKSLEDGMDASDVFLGMRSIELAGEVYAATKGGLYDTLDILRLTFTPTDAYNESPSQRGYLPLYFSQPTLLLGHHPDGFIERVAYARPAATPSYEVQFAGLGGDPARGFSVPFTARLECKDPRFYADQRTEVYFSGTESPVGAFVINRGLYAAPVNFLLQMPASQTAEALFDFNGMDSHFTCKIPAGTQERVVRIDSLQKVVTVTTNNIETLRMDLPVFLSGSTWPKVKHTPQTDVDGIAYSWTCTEALGSASRLFFQEAWV